MLIHTATRSVVLNLNEPKRVTTVVPTAKEFKFQGRTLVAVPHRVEETRVLRNMGFKVPSPIRQHYDWPGRHRPFKAQIETSDFLTINPRAFCLNDMGTGKTLSALWAYDFLRRQGLVKKMLVVSPLSTLERTWADEVFKNFPHLSTAVLHGTSERRRKMLGLDVDIYIINHHGITVIEKELATRNDIDVVVIDESAVFRNARTQLWKALNRIVADRPYVWAMTGTPTPNLPTDAWAQCRLIAPHRVPKYYGQFRDAVLRQLGPFKWSIRENAVDVVAEAMRPAIRFKREECVDLPPCTFVTRQVPLSKEQREGYQDMLRQLKLDHDEGQALAVNEAVKVSKLVQIACGVVYGEGGLELQLPCKPRVDEVQEIIEQAGRKVIVFVPYRAPLTYLVGELRDRGLSVAEIHGGTSKAERDRVFRAFQHAAEPRVLVAQPAAMSHGLTLTAANTVVWYAPIMSNETFEQANARVTRPGQTSNQLVVMIEGSEIETKIYNRLRSKQKLQGVLLDVLREE